MHAVLVLNFKNILFVYFEYILSDKARIIREAELMVLFWL